MTKRDWWLVGAGMNVSGAVVGALLHSAFLMVWNMAWLGISIYAVQTLEEK